MDMGGSCNGGACKLRAWKGYITPLLMVSGARGLLVPFSDSQQLILAAVNEYAAAS